MSTNEEEFPVGLYRKKPVVVEALQLTYGNVARVAEWCGASSWDAWGLTIQTLEGMMDADCGREDWIIKGVAGEFYPCKPDIFDVTYEAAT